MSRNPNIQRAARVVAEAIVHGASSDVALEVATALDDAGLLVRPGAEPSSDSSGRRAPSPAALAALAECRKAKSVADSAQSAVAELPGGQVSASGGEVTFVVHPRSLSEWKQWTLALGVDDRLAVNFGGSMVARVTYGGVRARLVGHGVPALLRDWLINSSKGHAHA
ncbi:hypothetical protein [Streptomyces chumphonensis]|uniref:hypothetical protein n=1 Tax=Streptomyces chumphonensis TaxID=1214925 RepID=UPI003D757730